mmetsp:Transcript_19085/g.31258  ORF Transcript_19085/g.31258 Transcript_19085/m.31258 type:complete len:462 (-) Transcript_19085:429-1814(-)
MFYAFQTGLTAHVVHSTRRGGWHSQCEVLCCRDAAFSRWHSFNVGNTFLPSSRVYFYHNRQLTFTTTRGKTLYPYFPITTVLASEALDGKSLEPKPPQASFLSGTTLQWILSGCLAVVATFLDVMHRAPLLSSQSLLLPLVGCAVGTGVLGEYAVPFLRELKARQFIREDGPQSHLKKAGTPTMGGLFLLPIPLVAAILLTSGSPLVVAVCLLTVAFGAIGFADDWMILRLQSNTGISPQLKLGLQILAASIYCLWLAAHNGYPLNVGLPFGLSIPLGPLYWPFAVFVLAAMSNGVNITDGLDGLAGGTVAVACIGLCIISWAFNPGLAVLCSCIAGGCLGFVYHNRNPSKVFMGDTGSLALGGLLGAVGVAAPPAWGIWCLLMVSGVFFVETCSVIAQVAYFKYTKKRSSNKQGKRLLKMAPLHHHLELSGWPEIAVVGVLYAASVVCVLLAGLSYIFMR